MYQDLDDVEPVSDTFGEQATNAGIYSVILPQLGSCALTYDAGDMTVDLAAGRIVHFGNPVTVALAANAFTLVADTTYPRWTWLALSSAGAAAVVSGSPAAVPSVPELGDRVALALVYVQAGLTVANNATYKLDKRLPTPGGSILVGYSDTATATISTTAVDLVTISSLSIPVGFTVRVEFNYRKTATAAQAVAFGIKVNSTIVQEATVSAGVPRSSASNQAENGMAIYKIMPRSSTNYTSGAWWDFATYVTSSGFNAASLAQDISAGGFTRSLSAPMPNATITSIAIRAINGTSNNNAEVTAVRVYVDF